MGLEFSHCRYCCHDRVTSQLRIALSYYGKIISPQAFGWRCTGLPSASGFPSRGSSPLAMGLVLVFVKRVLPFFIVCLELDDHSLSSKYYIGLRLINEMHDQYTYTRSHNRDRNVYTCIHVQYCG